VKKLAILLKAISHPKRLEIALLLRDSELSVTEIQEKIKCSQATTSQFLIQLKTYGFAQCRSHKCNRYYSLTTTGENILDDMHDIIRKYE
jgi:DNA-binding transcriptional ArsR family regulator